MRLIIVILVCLTTSCSSLVNTTFEDGTTNESFKVEKDQEFIGKEYKCMGHIGVKCRWTDWPFPELENHFSELKKQKKLKGNLLFKKKKREGVSWLTFLTLGLYPSTIVYDYKIVYLVDGKLVKTIRASLQVSTGIINNFKGGKFKVDYVKEEKMIIERVLLNE